MSACPTCGKAARERVANPAAPFCSPPCKQVDLGKWLDEAYRVPVTESDSMPDDGNPESVHETNLAHEKREMH